VQELRQWQREWREENRAKTFSFVGDGTTSADEKPSTPPPEQTQHTASADDSTVEVPQAEDTEDKADEVENIDDTASPSDVTRAPATECECNS